MYFFIFASYCEPLTSLSTLHIAHQDLHDDISVFLIFWEIDSKKWGCFLAGDIGDRGLLCREGKSAAMERKKKKKEEKKKKEKKRKKKRKKERNGYYPILVTFLKKNCQNFGNFILGHTV